MQRSYNGFNLVLVARRVINGADTKGNLPLISAKGLPPLSNNNWQILWNPGASYMYAKYDVAVGTSVKQCEIVGFNILLPPLS